MIPEEIILFINQIKLQNIDFNNNYCGKITFYSINQLEINYIPYNKNKKIGYIKVVDIIKDCDKVTPYGVFIYLPDYKLFGTYDRDTKEIIVYKNTNIEDIQSDLIKYINFHWKKNLEICEKLNTVNKVITPNNKNETKIFKNLNLKAHYLRVKYKNISNKNVLNCVIFIICFIRKKKLRVLFEILFWTPLIFFVIFLEFIIDNKNNFNFDMILLIFGIYLLFLSIWNCLNDFVSNGYIRSVNSGTFIGAIIWIFVWVIAIILK